MRPPDRIMSLNPGLAGPRHPTAAAASGRDGPCRRRTCLDDVLVAIILRSGSRASMWWTWPATDQEIRVLRRAGRGIARETGGGTGMGRSRRRSSAALEIARRYSQEAAPKRRGSERRKTRAPPERRREVARQGDLLGAPVGFQELSEVVRWRSRAAYSTPVCSSARGVQRSHPVVHGRRGAGA